MSLSDAWRAFVPPPRPLGDGDKWNVFLSYRSIDRAWVLNLYDALRQHNHKVFLDQVVLKPGDELQVELQDALAASQAGVLVWSQATRDSAWVRREYQVLERRAEKRASFQFVPVNLDGSILPDILENRIFVDFRDYPDGPNGGELLRLLHAVVGVPMSEAAVQAAEQQTQDTRTAMQQVSAAIQIGNAARLQALYAQSGEPWRVSSTLACRAAEGLTRFGKHEEAVAMLEQIQQQFPKAIRPRQLLALALARVAAKDKNDDSLLLRSQEIVAMLYDAGQRDPETLEIYGRTWMDRYARTHNLLYLKRSRDLYAEAFRMAPDDSYTGINAASKSVFIGTPEDRQAGAAYAAKVQALVGEDATIGDIWHRATVAEVFLLQQKYEQAAKAYALAVEAAPTEEGNHNAMWTQAKRILEKLAAAPEHVEAIRAAFAHLQE